jgi:CO dehydrogenase/acetyl-CoA synthase epsilon subunit
MFYTKFTGFFTVSNFTCLDYRFQYDTALFYSVQKYHLQKLLIFQRSITALTFEPVH